MERKRSPQNINYLICIDHVNIFSKNKKNIFKTLIHTFIILSQNIGMELGIKKTKILILNKGKKMNNRRYKTTQSG